MDCGVYSKLNLRTIALLISLELALSAIAQPAGAMTQDPIAAAAAAHQSSASPLSEATTSINRSLESAANQAETMVNQVESAIVNLPNSLSTIANSAIAQIANIHIPDLGDLITGILNGNQQDQTAVVLENGTGTYAIKEDLSKQAVRDATQETAQRSALSPTAQQQIAQILNTTQAATNENTQLGQDSQGRDVTQQILQNLSLQTAKAGQVNQQILEEAQQARVDRAAQIVLSTQMAKELSAMNTSDRRKSIANGNSANAQAGLLIMPGGYTIGSQTQARP